MNVPALTKGEKISHISALLQTQILSADRASTAFTSALCEKVFCISPMNGAEDAIHAVANNFSDFLSLLMACGDTAAIEQAWQWDKSSFEKFLAEYPPTDEAKSAFAQLEQKLGIVPMAEPYDYMMNLQKDFDYSKLKFTEEYYDILGIPMP